jgi:uncharacterized protein DUF397
MEFSDAQWRKSSFSTDQTNCVEINYQIGIRDSKNPASRHLTVPDTALRGLVRRAAG